MQSEKDLIELAAKAAGIELAFWDEASAQWFRVKDDPAKLGYGSAVFDPLTDDGDAFRLAVAIRRFPEFQYGGRKITAGHERAQGVGQPYQPIHEPANLGAEAARRAIVRAAAEIGRGMP